MLILLFTKESSQDMKAKVMRIFLLTIEIGF